MIWGCLKLGLPTSPGKGLFLQEAIPIYCHLRLKFETRKRVKIPEDRLWPRSHLCFATSTLWTARRYKGA